MCFADVFFVDPVDGVLELLIVRDDLRDVLVDVMRVLELLGLRDVDIPLSSLFVLSIVPLSDFVLSSIVSLLLIGWSQSGTVPNRFHRWASTLSWVTAAQVRRAKLDLEFPA